MADNLGRRRAAGRHAVHREVGSGLAELVPDLSRPGNWLLFLDGVPQSQVDLEDPGYLEFEYVRRIGHLADLAFTGREPLRVLHLGGGAMTLPRYVAHTRPGSRQLVAETDAALTELVRRQLPLPPGPGRIRVRAEDARKVLESVPAGGYDLVISDVFEGARTPFPMTTVECARAAARAVAPGGVYAVNVADGPPLGVARAAAATIRSVFEHTCLIAEPGVLHGRRLGNFVLGGSQRPLPRAGLRRRVAADPFPARVLDGAELARFASSASVVTDTSPIAAAPHPTKWLHVPFAHSDSLRAVYPCPMDLPRSGWYPDPYGVPGLLRWWDGAAWTDQTILETTSGAEQPAGSPTTADATTAQPAMTAVHATVQGAPQGQQDNSTRILVLDDTAWITPGPPARRRRRLVMGGVLAVGVAAALAVIALVINSLGESPATPAAAANPAGPAPAPSTASAASPSPSPSASAASAITDATSGLTYAQLAAPWAAGCPGSLNGQAFTWSAGESAVAGQINNGQANWFGVACSGTLPQQYGYNGTADLENVTNNLVNTFNGTYYSALPHNFQPMLSQPVSVSGHPGWEIKFLMTYTSPQGLAWTSELGAVVVTDAGTGAAPAVFYVSVPSNLGEAHVDSLVASLKLSAVPQQGGSPDAGPPGQNGGNGHGNGHGNG